MFLICGSGRSGTSAVARLLHEAGITMGRDLIEADESNAEGYFEERAVIELDDVILRDAGLGPWFATASREVVLESARQHGEAMQALAAEATPGWKDPRFSWTLEAWLEVLPERPRLIICLRSPAEVVASTLRYYGLEGDEATRAVEHTWRCEYERLLEVIDAYSLDAICIEYAQLISDPDAAIAPLAGFVGRELDAAGVRRDLKHHAAPVQRKFAKLYKRVAALGKA
jgi:hypothetical protein